jgi:asparagine synthase (glutamine-hydrolysing)
VTGLADLGLLPSWFVALADRDSAGPLGDALRCHATREVSHPSGRPWLLGRWPESMLSSGRAGATKIAIIGQHALTSEQLAGAAGRIRAVADLDRVAGSLVGSAHLLASVDGRVRAQGTVTGIRRVFHARVAGTTVAADRADVLAHLLNSSLDEQRLALHLLEPPILYPLAGQPVWHGVALLPTDS